MKKDGDPRKTKAELFPLTKDRIIFALNTSDFVRAHCLITLLSNHVGYFKFGPELTCAMLASMFCPSDAVAIDNMVKIRAIFNEAKGRIFWDGRLVGIAGTIGPTLKILSDLGVCMLSVQAEQGKKSITAAIDNKGKSMLFAATPRSSVDHEECYRVRSMTSKQSTRLMQIAELSGIDGVICSSHETANIRLHVPESIIATRDVRPNWVSVKNRKKVITPGEAILAGADAVIIGKPISQPPNFIGDPTRAAEQIVLEIEAALEKLKQVTEQKGAI